jgi:hypothetical protein
MKSKTMAYLLNSPGPAGAYPVGQSAQSQVGGWLAQRNAQGIAAESPVQGWP